MKIAHALLWAQDQLKGLPQPRLESEILCASILGKDRVFIKTHPEKILSDFEQQQFQQYIRQRKSRTPVAQIIGYKHWNGLQLFVNEQVLIPRDETEILAHYICKNQNIPPQSILDIGTGSGCLAIFLAQQFPEAKIWALDISLGALKVAKKNAERHQVNIHFIKSDLLEQIEEGLFFDIIVANLPYVPFDMALEPEVKKEPLTALFAEDNGLALIRKLDQKLKDKKIIFRKLWLEFLPQQKAEIAQIFSAYKIEFFTDIGGDVFFACMEPKRT